MTVVSSNKKELEEEDGDGDSNCSASKVQEFLESYKETSKERCDVAVLEDDDIVCDIANNMIEIKRGLGPDLAVVQDDVLGGMGGAIYCRWRRGTSYINL
jgi:hypothetical protein